MKPIKIFIKPLTIAAAAAVIAGCATSHNQTSADYGQVEEESDRVVVTGSRIRREDITTETNETTVTTIVESTTITKQIGVQRLISPDYGHQVFKKYGVNPTIDTLQENKSTFAMDIDNASYRLAKTMLERGQLPDPAGIRTEEFVNGLDYQYLPSKDLIGLSAEVVPSPFRPGYHVLHLGVQIKQITDSERLPSNLVLVVDISGSMKSDNKIDTLKSAMRSLVAQLGAQDTVGIVAYNNSASTVLYPTSAKNKAMIYKQIDSLATGGGTNAAQGIIKGYQLADKIFKRGYNNRVILTSDGMANVGDVKPEEILNKVNQYKKKGVFLTTVGVGAGMYNDHLLEQLANKGNGNYVYLSDKEDIEDTFVDGINSQLQTMVKDAKIQLKFNPDVVSRFRQIGYENRSLNHQDFTDGSKDGGELGAGHRVTALYEIKLNPSNTTDPIGDFAVSYKKPMGNKVFLLEKKLPAGIVRPTIERAASDTKLSIVAAGLAEKLRQTYWSSFYQYSVMMNLMQQLPPNYSNTRMVTGLRQMVINAMRLDNRVNPYSNDAQPVTLSFDHVPLIE